MEPRSDFRSDTVTRPSEAMRAAMARARVGDDVFGDDPTVKELEARLAELLGKEAALFCPSGTMANQAAVRCHCRSGDEVLLHEGCHTYRFEQGGLAALHGVQAVPLSGDLGMVPPEAFEREIRVDDPHFARTRLIVVENTHNLAGGVPLPLEYMDAVAEVARRRGLALHVDGARLLNAAVALDVSAARLAHGADSVTLCLSKGVGAPVGTGLAGSAAFIASARRARKVLGGGMRQVGILAAAALVALEDAELRLREDHRLAAELARGLAAVSGVEVVPPRTNIVVVALPGRDVSAVLDGLRERGVLAVPFGPGRIRFVTHRDVDESDVSRAVAAFEEVLRPEGERA